MPEPCRSRHEHDGWRPRGKLQLGCVFAKDRDQFIANDLDHLLGGRERGQHFLAERLLADVVDQLFYDLEVDVGFQQRHTNFFQRLADVFFGQRALPAQVLECTLKFICQVFKHSSGIQNGGWMGESWCSASLFRISRKIRQHV